MLGLRREVARAKRALADPTACTACSCTKSEKKEEEGENATAAETVGEDSIPTMEAQSDAATEAEATVSEATEATATAATATSATATATTAVGLACAPCAGCERQRREAEALALETWLRVRGLWLEASPSELAAEADTLADSSDSDDDGDGLSE